MTDEPLTLEIQLQSDDLDPNDERWEAQVRTLLDDVKAEGAQVERIESSAPGQKGGVLSAIGLVLGNAEVLGAIVRVIRSWLSSGKRRVKFADGTEIEGNFDDATILKLMKEHGGRKSKPKAKSKKRG